MTVLKACVSVLVVMSIYERDTADATKIVPPKEKCISCLREASASNPDDDKALGPYHITQSFWSDAGSKHLTDSTETGLRAFKECANDDKCARATVKSYLKAYAKDCNKDNKINCDDYALIYTLGRKSCQEADLRNEQKTQFINRFQRCYYTSGS